MSQEILNFRRANKSYRQTECKKEQTPLRNRAREYNMCMNSLRMTAFIQIIVRYTSRKGRLQTKLKTISRETDHQNKMTKKTQKNTTNAPDSNEKASRVALELNGLLVARAYTTCS